MVRVTRRSMLRGGVLAGSALLAGCAAPFESGPDAGALVVKNQHELAHVVEISVVDGPETAEAVEQELSGTFALDAGERRVYSDFLSESGTYVVQANLGDESARIEYDPTKQSGRVLTVEISEDGRLDWTVSAVE